MKKFAFILSFFIFAFCFLHFDLKSQPTLEWAARFVTLPGQVQYISDVITDPGGNTFITGRIEWGSYPNDSMVCVTLKINSSGVIQWSSIYNGERGKFTKGNALAIDNHGNVYVSGSTLTQTTGLDYLTIKYNNDGDTIWTRKYDGADSLDADGADDIAVDDSGNVFVTGHLYQSSFPDYCTIKYNSSGNLLWVRYYNGPANRNDFAKQIAIDKNGEIIVTGNSERVSNGITDVVTLKYNPAGTLLWDKTYAGVNNQGAAFPDNLIIDDSSNIIFSCSGSRIIKFNSFGDSLLNFLVSDSTQVNYSLYIKSFLIDSLKNFYIASTVPEMSIRTDCFTAKYDFIGNRLWQRKYAENLFMSDDGGNNIARDKYRNLYVAGYMDSNWLFHDFLTIKYDSLGNFLWKDRYSFAQFSDDRGFYIFLDSMNNIYVTGITAGGGIEFGGNITTIKYSQPPVGVINIGSEVPTVSKLFQNFPNPFNTTTNFEFRIAHFGFVTLQIYNVLGQTITELVNKQLKGGNYRINWDASQYPSGIYFYRLIAEGNIIDTKKLILIK